MTNYTKIYLINLIIVFACSKKTNIQDTEVNKIENKKIEEKLIEKENQSVIVGNEIDNHGCNISAGYIWSEVKNECIKTWEVGKPLKSSSKSNFNAYIVFSSDSMKVEIFSKEKKEVLIKNGKEKYQKQEKMLQKLNNKWTLFENQKVFYQE